MFKSLYLKYVSLFDFQQHNAVFGDKILLNEFNA